MSKKELRNRLVEYLSNNLESIQMKVENGTTFSYKKHFICPLCLQVFALDEVEDVEKVLSLEDIPPKALGGRPLSITCKTCNNTCGHALDNHLINELKNRHYVSLWEREGKNATLSFDNISVNIQSKIITDEKKVLINIDDKCNNPRDVSSFLTKMECLKEKPLQIQIKLSALKRNPNAINIAILKNAYLLAFCLFGYRYILRPSLDKIRVQILYPDKEILPHNYILFQNENIPQTLSDGIYLAAIDQQTFIAVVFSLKLPGEIYSHRFFVALPDFKDVEAQIYLGILNNYDKSSVSILAKYPPIKKCIQ